MLLELLGVFAYDVVEPQVQLVVREQLLRLHCSFSRRVTIRLLQQVHNEAALSIGHTVQRQCSGE